MSTNLNILAMHQNLVSRGMRNITVKCVDSKALTPNLAKVVIEANVKDGRQEDYYAAICDHFKNKARPVEASFRWVPSKSAFPTMVGFIKTNIGVREIASKNESYMRVMASNVLMDSRDESFWKIESMNGSQVLVRQSDENIEQLLECASMQRSTLSTRIQPVAVEADYSTNRKFVAFVHPKTREVAHGYVLSSDGSDVEILVREDVVSDPTKIKPLGSKKAFPNQTYVPDENNNSNPTDLDGSGKNPIDKEDLITESKKYDGKDILNVHSSAIIEIANMNGDDCFEELAAPETSDKKRMIDYYRKVWGEIDTNYFNEIVKIINSHAAL